MARKAGAPKVQVEVSLPEGHPATLRLQREAQKRGVELAGHIRDLLIDRELFLSNDPDTQQTWMPRGIVLAQAVAGPVANGEADEDTPVATPAAKSAARAWIRRKTG